MLLFGFFYGICVVTTEISLGLSNLRSYLISMEHWWSTTIILLSSGFYLPWGTV